MNRALAAEFDEARSRAPMNQIRLCESAPMNQIYLANKYDVRWIFDLDFNLNDNFNHNVNLNLNDNLNFDLNFFVYYKGNGGLN